MEGVAEQGQREGDWERREGGKGRPEKRYMKSENIEDWGRERM